MLSCQMRDIKLNWKHYKLHGKRDFGHWILNMSSYCRCKLSNYMYPHVPILQQEQKSVLFDLLEMYLNIYRNLDIC